MATDSYTYPETRGVLQTLIEAHATYPVTALLVAGYTYDDGHVDVADITNELSGGSYARVALTGVSYSVVDDTSSGLAADPSFAALTATGVDGVVIFADEGADADSRLICYIQLPPTNFTTEVVDVELAEGKLFEFDNADPDVSTVAGESPDSAGDIDAAGLATALGPYLDTYELAGRTGTFIWDPDGVYSGDNSYNDWSAFTAAITAAEYGTKEIVLAKATTFPSGAFDMNGGHFVGGLPGQRPQMTFADGATLTNHGHDIAHYSMTLYSESTSPVITMAATGELVFEAGIIVASKTAAFIDVTATSGATCSVSLRNSHFYKPSDLGIMTGDYPVFEVTGSPTFAGVAGVVGVCDIKQDTLKGSAVTAIKGTSATTVGTQAGVSTLTTLVQTSAASVAGDASGMTNSSEDDVQGILEDLDSAITGGGIPASTFDAKGDLLAASADDTAARLAVGSDDQVLTADSGEATGLIWATPSDDVTKATYTTKGDIVAATASATISRLGVGANDTVLTADSAESTGLKWAAAAGGGLAVVQESNTSMSVPGVTFLYANATVTLGQYDKIGMPFRVEKAIDVSAVKANVITAQASSSFRIGIYAIDSTGQPTAVSGDSGVLSSATTGIKTWTPGAAISLTAGNYALALTCDDAAVAFRACIWVGPGCSYATSTMNHISNWGLKDTTPSSLDAFAAGDTFDTYWGQSSGYGASFPTLPMTWTTP